MGLAEALSEALTLLKNQKYRSMLFGVFVQVRLPRIGFWKKPTPIKFFKTITHLVSRSIGLPWMKGTPCHWKNHWECDAAGYRVALGWLNEARSRA